MQIVSRPDYDQICLRITKHLFHIGHGMHEAKLFSDALRGGARSCRHGMKFDALRLEVRQQGRRHIISRSNHAHTNFVCTWLALLAGLLEGDPALQLSFRVVIEYYTEMRF